MAYTTAGGTKKKVCYYYDGMGHPERVMGSPNWAIWQANASQLVSVAAGECILFNTSKLTSRR